MAEEAGGAGSAGRSGVDRHGDFALEAGGGRGCGMGYVRGLEAEHGRVEVELDVRLKGVDDG